MKMAEALNLWEKPEAREIYMLAGWRQWADAGGVSSGLPKYLAQLSDARKIGEIGNEGFYLFQIPGTHDLVRPAVKFKQGYPGPIQVPRNELFYAGDEARGVVFFLGDEPHLDIERYAEAFLGAAQTLGVKRIISLGGVYGELPYNKERLVSCIYSQKRIRKEMDRLAVNLSDYQGGASIGSYLCRRAGERKMEFVGFYAFVPTYDFSNISQMGNAFRIESDYMAWLGIMNRVNYMLKLDFDLSDLEAKSQHLIEVVDEKVEEIDRVAPQVGVRDYMARLEEEFTEIPFNPLDDIWEEQLRRLFGKYEADESD